MRRRRFLGRVGVAGAVGTAGCGFRGLGSDEGPPRRFRVGDEGFEVAVDGGAFDSLSVRGVNLGMAKPGRFPGEAAITRAEYDRWLELMGELRVNVVRVYTVHPPALYRALAAYNRSHADPIYVLHGNWIGEETLREAGDATSLSPSFDRSMRQVVDAVHGATTVEPELGYASGTYDADVSDAVLGYVVGIEWPPAVVRETNWVTEATGHDGEFLAAPDGSPFEAWLAARLDAAVAYEADEYGAQRPAAFTNWVTTDPLDHPYEPFPDEDAVSVDPDAVVATDASEAGTFAAYHVYPYYPPLLNETPEYANYVDHRGEPNSYAGYLNDLVGATDHPLLVAEFGVPSSRGISQRDVHGRDQGRHTETEQGGILAAMYEDIREADTAGGIVFSWHDEWFKRTWNFAPFSDPNRRPFWSNVQTPEQRFGLLAFDPANAVPLDGSPDAWRDATAATPARDPVRLGDGADGARELTALRVTSDAAYLSVRLELADLGGEPDWDATNYLLALGLTDRGERLLPYGLDATAPADFVVRLGGPDASRVTVEPRYDAFAYEYGAGAGLDLDRYRDPAPGDFTPLRTVINRGYTVPETGERVPFESVETGGLRYGNGNPDSPRYDSLADVHVSPSNDAVEVRLPWLLLNVADPSRRRRLGDFWAEGLDAYETFESIDVAAASYVPGDGGGDATALDAETNLTHAVPGSADGGLDALSYVPQTWDRPAYTERLKESGRAVGDVFERYAGREE
ncbi:hypothetical protein C463_15060 [Halorubrum californiense DSM 19288]|uniref:Family 2 glycosyl transferase n=1 Tax=Halorubrum californiense DSM 19288 TaxID=1227465 RepID=M0DXL6_9EURY|nr:MULTISPECIES: hypothetical protein [Halorubrum]ELZ40251.1 hypothetical protein C463_15060 [Halorubrum californiense DSM 19288]TKX68511.1 hypothetical protein EXE40_12455 [Halorubrum sp. GN11GM_10-3_MGM]